MFPSKITIFYRLLDASVTIGQHTEMDLLPVISRRTWSSNCAPDINIVIILRYQAFHAATSTEICNGAR
jgi:hypothetical protein